MKAIFTDIEKQFIKYNFQKMSMKDIAKHLGCSSTRVLGFYKKNGLETSKEQQILFRIEKIKGKTTFTKEEDQYIKENYLLKPIKIIAKEINRSYCGITGRLKVMGLIIPKELAAQRKGHVNFQKGHISLNKGKKQSEYMSPEAIERTKKTQFKGGEMPHNSLPVGAEVNRVSKGGKKYIMLKVEGQSKLVFKHTYIWEQHTKKKIPNGFNVVFKDGNTNNCTIENLECISDQELMKRNTISQYPEDLKKLIKANNKLKKKIYEKQSRGSKEHFV